MSNSDLTKRLCKRIILSLELEKVFTVITMVKLIQETTPVVLEDMKTKTLFWKDVLILKEMATEGY